MMDAKEARKYLLALRRSLAEDDKERYAGWIDALDTALDAVAPPMGAGMCRWIYLPDEDLMPYEHLDSITALTDLINSKQHQEPPEYAIELNEEYMDIMATALLAYKSVLMEVHKEKVKEKLKSLVGAIGKKQKEGKLWT